MVENQEILEADSPVFVRFFKRGPVENLDGSVTDGLGIGDVVGGDVLGVENDGKAGLIPASRVFARRDTVGQIGQGNQVEGLGEMIVDRAHLFHVQELGRGGADVGIDAETVDSSLVRRDTRDGADIVFPAGPKTDKSVVFIRSQQRESLREGLGEEVLVKIEESSVLVENRQNSLFLWIDRHDKFQIQSAGR